MAYTEIYYKDWCPYSRRALALLTRKGVAFVAIDLTADAGDREREMRERSGRMTVPQIFINGRPVGGFDDLSALDRSGELDRMLSGERSNSLA
jgi:glutaredoxin 3